jgi:hypothetical protein
LRVYHFLNSKYGLENVRRKRLKIARLDDLNDPFELLSPELSDSKLRVAFESVKTQLSKNRGILCFSESWQNPVMWSHYADKHKGVCLEFEVPEELLAKINYSQSRLRHEIRSLLNSNSESSESAMTLVLTTKFSHWRYERERRIFVGLEDIDKDGNYFADFSEKLKLKRIIVGPRSQITRAKINESIRLAKFTHEIGCFKARLAFKSFRVVRNRNERLWV